MATTRVKVTNIGCATKTEELHDFFKIPGVTLELGTEEEGENFVVANVPSEKAQEFVSYNGREFRGKVINVRIVADGGPVSSQEVERDPTHTQQSTRATEYPEIVHLDFSHARDVYQYRKLSMAEVVMAVRHTFGDDESRRLLPPRRKDDTLWVIETDTIDKYKGIDMVRDGGENDVATVSIKQPVVVTSDDGEQSRVKYVNRKAGRQEGDLLLTLVHADTRRFRHVSDEELTRQVVNLGIGRIKRGVQMQPIRGTREPSGNKYVILENVNEVDKKKIPPSFDFPGPRGKGGRIWINYYGKPRKCYFCNAFHEQSVVTCPLEVTVRNMELERERTLRKIKTYSDSTLRLVRQTSLTGDVDAMSGGTVGNILNAVDVDKPDKSVENILIVGGQNDLHRRMTNEEFAWISRSEEERLKKLAEKKKVAVLAPPIQVFLDPESQAREEMFRSSLTKLNDAGSISLWENPVQQFEDDYGRHPSVEQTRTMITFIDKKCREVFGEPFILDSATATDEILTTRLYAGVNSLYRFGCAGCNGRAKNRWHNLCNECMSSLEGDESISAEAVKIAERALAIYSDENPQIEVGDVEMDEGLVCEECKVSFSDGKEIREHFNSHHEGVVDQPTKKDNRKKNKASSPLKATDEGDVRANKVLKNDS